MENEAQKLSKTKNTNRTLCFLGASQSADSVLTSFHRVTSSNPLLRCVGLDADVQPAFGIAGGMVDSKQYVVELHRWILCGLLWLTGLHADGLQLLQADTDGLDLASAKAVFAHGVLDRGGDLGERLVGLANSGLAGVDGGLELGKGGGVGRRGFGRHGGLLFGCGRVYGARRRPRP